ncbi:hypothetical protein CALVIDRAFT_71146 [Calocera viscosa TUFC12733]|uniref:Uncharacterized protein n=1 Tax=Calocera viscosa (strain TUFC12733) TaxID=1330018 RepID=A0A167NAV1_CALVF|nr:hypothetical protein CALVIDRAFT_71146 [Calocera viscosa TUFC12733]
MKCVFWVCLVPFFIAHFVRCSKVTHVWMGRWGLPACLYLVSRYLGIILYLTQPLGALVTAIPSRLCQVWVPLELILIQVVGGCCDGLLLMRVLALFGHKRWLGLTLFGLYVLTYLIEAVFAVIKLVTSLRTPLGPPQWDCAAERLTSALVDSLATLPVLIFNGASALEP